MTAKNKERLLRPLNKQGVEWPLVICPGDTMNAAIAGVMRKTGRALPEARHTAGLMENFAYDVSAIHGTGVPVITHICGNVKNVAAFTEVVKNGV
jgi:hypothetical protein